MGSKERFKLIPAAYLFLVKDGKILLSRRFQTGYEDGNYSVPAGHVDGGEAAREALVREAREEIGIVIVPEQLRHVHTMHRFCGDHERVDLFFSADEWRGEVGNLEPDKCDDLQWFPLHQLPENTIPCVRQAIECYDRGIGYSEFGWDNQG